MNCVTAAAVAVETTTTTINNSEGQASVLRRQLKNKKCRKNILQQRIEYKCECECEYECTLNPASLFTRLVLQSYHAYYRIFRNYAANFYSTLFGAF